MDDFSSKLNEILADPVALAQIAELSKRFNGNNNPTAAVTTEQTKPPPPPEAPASNNSEPQKTSRDEDSIPTSLGGLESLMQGSSVLSGLASPPSEHEAFLKSLRPLLNSNRQKRVDDLIRAAGLIKLIEGLRK